MHVVIQIQSFRRKPKNLKSLFSRNKQRSKDIKHFTTASAIKSYQGHLQKHNPQEMITQYACNKPASWPLNIIRLNAAKTRFTQSKFRVLHVLHSVMLVTFVREKKRKRTTVQADSQGHVSHYHELMSRVWLVNAYFLLASLWWAVGEEFQSAGTEKMHPLSLCVHFRKDFALKWPVFFELLWV